MYIMHASSAGCLLLLAHLNFSPKKNRSLTIYLSGEKKKKKTVTNILQSNVNYSGT